MKGIFITGTDTGVGKTLVTGYLGSYLRKQGRRVVTQKWVETGCDGTSSDLRMHALLGAIDDGLISTMEPLLCPYRFRLAASPHFAAAREGRSIDPAVIERAYQKLLKEHDIVLVESAGGALVPLTESLLAADLAARMGMVALVVVRNRLGAINHSLLTIEALAKRGVRLMGLVFNRIDEGDESVLADNPRIVRELSGARFLGEMPMLADPLKGADAFEPIGRAFVARWSEMSGYE